MSTAPTTTVILLTLTLVVSTYGPTCALRAGDGSQVHPFSAKYAPLYRDHVRENPDGSRSFHQGTLFRRSGIYVLHLKGDRFEMAFQHGTLLKEQISEGVAIGAARMVERTVRNSVGDRPRIARMATNYIHKRYTDQLWFAAGRMKTVDPTYLDEVSGGSAGSGISRVQTFRGLLAPEVLFVLSADQARKRCPRQYVPHAAQCSGFVAWGPYTRDSELIVARNTDYGLNGYFDRFPTVIYYEPTDCDMRYMTVASAGVPYAGLVSLNEAGIFLGAHIIPSNASSVCGVSALLIATHVMRTARTFDEAVATFKTMRPPTGWAYTLVSVDEKRVGSVELNSQRVMVRESRDGVHVQTNHFLVPEMQPSQLAINHSEEQDTRARYARIEQRLQDAKGEVSERLAMQILADHVDPLSRKTSAFLNTVSVHTTMTSVVLVPNNGRIYVANGMAPVCENTYVELPTVDRFNPDTFLDDDYATVTNDDFKREHPKMAAAEQLLIKAKKAYEYRNDHVEALRLLKQAINLDGENAAYHFVAAIMASKAGHYSYATSALKRSLELGTSPHRRLLSHYYLGRVYAHLGYEKAARERFSIVTVSDESEPKLRAAAARSYRKTRRLRRHQLKPKSLPIVFQFADMLEY